MIETNLDQVVEYPIEIIRRISADKHCVGLLVNKPFEQVNEEDFDTASDENIYDYDYVPETNTTPSAYVLVDTEVNRVENRTIKDMRLYITVICHKSFMKLDRKIFGGIVGNRRNNIVRCVNEVINGQSIIGIGAIALKSLRSVNAPDGFTAKELCYEIPDFNLAVQK